MRRKSKFSTDEKLDAVTNCIQGDSSVSHMAKLLDIDGTSLQQWIRNYESLGIDGLITPQKNMRYTKDFKEKAVLDYLSVKGSQADICKK